MMVIRYFLDQELQSSSCQKSFKGIHCGLLQTVCLFFEELNKRKGNRKIYLLGGEMRETTQCFVGEITNKSLQDMNFHKAFFSCNALNEQKIMTSTFEEGQTQQIALNNSVERFY